MLFVRALRTSTTKLPGISRNCTPTKKHLLQPVQFQLSYYSTSGIMAGPKYLTGDKAGIDAFVDQFDVSC
jgi:hypothetical protein